MEQHSIYLFNNISIICVTSVNSKFYTVTEYIFFSNELHRSVNIPIERMEQYKDSLTCIGLLPLNTKDIKSYSETTYPEYLV
ncbi:MAG: hypothetical protein BV457_05900 [Thermoplasmata archaeon M9B1D]|nr:MAG: hypothetical protein BV457_05900 [Thermoplasmata archaeon M9B1D]PNX51230.1 MAG: hypothetical protein BV456_03985 [Thermoplasmata archaeon M8B2D]